MLVLVVLSSIMYVRSFEKDDWLQQGSQYDPGRSHSYLDWPRIHFAGHFRADSPTGNNKCENYDITRFDQNLRKNPNQGSWNPKGSGRFMLEGCEITSVCYDNGECVTTNDELIGQPVISNYNRPHAKLVGLDPAYMVSSIFGMYIKIPHMFSARHVEAPYTDKVRKSSNVPGDLGAGAVFHSLLVDLEWNQNNNRYRILEEMKGIVSQYPEPSALSIKSIVDSYEHNLEFRNCTQGRIVGTIGIAGPPEPFHVLRHREVHHIDRDMKPMKASFRVFPQRGKILLDIGNGLIHTLGAPDSDVNKRLQVVYPHSMNTNSYNCMTPVVVLGDIQYERDDWYTCSAGVVQIPTCGNLSTQQVQQIQERPLIIRRLDPRNGECLDMFSQEPSHGTIIGIMGDSLFHVNPYESWQVVVFASRFGKPLEGFKLAITEKREHTDCDGIRYPNNVPEKAVNYTKSADTDTTGIAVFDFNSSDPGSPRPIDGQLYVYDIVNEIDNDDESSMVNTRVSILLYTLYTVSEGGPTWYQDIYPIFKMYANMFPTMTSILNLASYEDVVRKKEMLKAAMSLPFTDPSYMPVTRDLSKSKQSAILEWLDDPKLGARPLVTLEELHGYLQTALEIELSTIPPYLSALFSIRKGHNNEVSNILRSVVLEEMLHMTLVANILSSICGSPTLNESSVIPRYPSTLPGNVHPGLTVSLGRFSLDLVEDVFLKIEEPDETLSLRFRQTLPPPHEPTEETEIPHHHYDTIGQFYYQNIWQSLNYITEQGEGSSPTQPYASMGELSHYYKFLEIVMGYRIVLHEPTLQEFGKGDIENICHLSYASMFSKLTTCGSEVNDCQATNFITKCDVPYYFTGERVSFYENGVWPTIDNPSSDLYPQNSKVRYVSDRFNEEYSNLLRCLHESFNVNSSNMVGCMSMMSYLEQLGRQLVEMPIDLNGSLHALPIFEYIDTTVEM
ncbi:uncharacterized protein LOC144350402 [Saccoglossus kowalevskii]